MKLAVAQVVEKICAFYGNLTFVDAFKTAGKWFLLEVDHCRLNISFLQELKELRSIYFAESPAQAEFCASRNWLYTWSNIWRSSWNPKCNTLEQERRQNDSPAACYRTAIVFRQLRLIALWVPQGNSGAVLENFTISLFIYSKIS
jgi:hypothetical protein